MIARDGFSGKIIASMTLPINNNVAIYDGVFKLVCVAIVYAAIKLSCSIAWYTII